MNTLRRSLICACIALLGIAGSFAQDSAPATAPANAAPAPWEDLSVRASDVLRLAQLGTEDSVMLAFIEAAEDPFRLSAANISYLQDNGLPASLIAAMLHQDVVLRGQRLDGIAPGNSEGASIVGTNIIPAELPAAELATDPPARVSHFYDALSPYGTWIELPEIGWCWQPRVASIDHAWRPYWHGGRWVFTEFGWYWHSDYSWGWAPFHYGRWQLHARCGWVWRPDIVWSPAWVCWRYSDMHCGWAPLPPGAVFVPGTGFQFRGVTVTASFDFRLDANCFVFVDLRHFADPHPHLHSVPPVRHVEIYKQTTIVNYFVGRNNTLISHGVPVARIAAITGKDIRPMPVRTAAFADHKPERIEMIDKVAVLHRPELPSPAHPPAAVAQRIDDQHPRIIPMRPAPRAMGAAPGGAGRSVGPATVPPQPAKPSVPEPIPVRPPSAGGTQPLPVARHELPSDRESPRETIPARSEAARLESPRGREQRLSRGLEMPQPTLRQVRELRIHDAPAPMKPRHN